MENPAQESNPLQEFEADLAAELVALNVDPDHVRDVLIPKYRQSINVAPDGTIEFYYEDTRLEADEGNLAHVAAEHIWRRARAGGGSKSSPRFDPAFAQEYAREKVNLWAETWDRFRLFSVADLVAIESRLSEKVTMNAERLIRLGEEWTKEAIGEGREEVLDAMDRRTKALMDVNTRDTRYLAVASRLVDYMIHNGPSVPSFGDLSSSRQQEITSPAGIQSLGPKNRQRLEWIERHLQTSTWADQTAMLLDLAKIENPELSNSGAALEKKADSLRSLMQQAFKAAGVTWPDSKDFPASWHRFFDTLQAEPSQVSTEPSD